MIPGSQFSHLRSRFAREEWNVGVLSQPVEDVVRGGIRTPIRWWRSCGAWEMLADPSCLIDSNGTRLIFAERLDYRTGRGEIWAARVPATKDLAEVRLEPWMRSRCHLSYPRPVIGPMGCLFFTAETAETGALHLWRRVGNSLVHVGPIIREPILDPTLYHDGTTWWLFCTSRRSGPNEKLLLFYADRLEGPWTAHPRNPVKIDPGSSRPAGPLIWVDGRLIRPAQDCSYTYGGELILNQVTRLDKDGYGEAVVRRLKPGAVYPDGLHTLCPAGDVTLIDGKRWSFRKADVLRKVIVSLFRRTRPLFRPGVPLQIMFPT